MKKKIISVLILISYICLSVNYRQSFSSNDAFLEMCKLHPIVFINNSAGDFQNAIPEIANGHTYLPARDFSDIIRSTMSWIPSISMLNMSLDGNFVLFDFLSNCYYLTSGEKNNNPPLLYKNSTAYVPLSVIAKEFKFNTYFLRDTDNWPIIIVRTNSSNDFGSNFSEKAFLSSNQRQLSLAKENIKSKIIDLVNTFEPKFNRENIILNNEEEIGNRLSVIIKNDYNQNYTLTWSKDLPDGTHVWEGQTYSLDAPSPHWYSWDAGEHKVSAKISNGFTEKIITTTIHVIQRNGKSVYITFDDGPNANTTTNLNILAQYNCKATFFLILNQYTSSQKPLIERIVKEGHTLGLHAYTHSPSKLFKTNSSLLENMNAANNTLFDLLGTKTFLCRIPYGSRQYATMEQFNSLKTAGYKVWDWNVESTDTKNSYVPPSEIVANTIKGMQNLDESVILFHDKIETTQALPKVIEYIQSNGYTIKTLDPSMPPKNFKDGAYIQPK